MKNYPLVVIIILNWNGWEDTLECLESVYEISYPNYMVIVVDNHSTDDSLEKIRKYCSGQITTESTFTNNGKPNNLLELIELSEEDLNDTEYIFNEGYSGLNNKLILIKNKVNYGFAGGNNVALKYAMEKSAAEYILLLNNDTVVHEDFLTELVLVAESNKEIGIVGPKTYFYDNKKTIQWAAGGFLDIEHIKVENLGSFEIDKSQHDHNVELDFIIGSCVLCKREVVKKIGLLDESYFMYFEDVDWSLRVLKEGYKCFYVYKSKIWHKMGRSSNNCFKTYYYQRNKIYVIKKNSKSSKFIKYLFKYLFTSFARENLDFIRVNGINMYIKCYLKGILTGVFKRN